MSGVAGPTGGRGRPAEPILAPMGPAERALAEAIELKRLRLACRTVTRAQDVWFSDRHDDRKKAVAACQGCPVAVECLAAGREIGARHGVWGGVSLTGGSTP